eukprot:m.247515 g.247515  ORF g.247515 m.247515 type:complete len:91 (-) comp51439_c0_seq1:252-524(-)
MHVRALLLSSSHIVHLLLLFVSDRCNLGFCSLLFDNPFTLLIFSTLFFFLLFALSSLVLYVFSLSFFKQFLTLIVLFDCFLRVCHTSVTL